MISFKAIQTSFTPTKHALFQKTELSRKNSSGLFLCKSKDSDADNPPPPKPEGDTRQQELLVRIAMLQAQKVRVDDYLDERSEYLTKFTQNANAELDKIGENALKDLEEASARRMEEIEKRMQDWEESTESNKLEIEENEQKVYDFEDQIEKGRNEGLFFQNLKEAKPVDKAKAKEEMEKIKEVTKESTGSKTRRNIYLGLIALVSVAIVDSWVSSSSNWRKAAVLAAILVGLLTQFTYEQRMLSEIEKIQEEEKEEERE